MQTLHLKKIHIKNSENKVIQPKHKEKYSLVDKEPGFYFRKIIYSQLLRSNGFMKTSVDKLGRVSTDVHY